MMVRSRGTTSGPIVEECKICIFSSQIQHIHITLPYALISMSGIRYHQMIRKNRIWIDQYVIFLVLASVELQHYLLLRPVVPAEEAFSSGNILLVQLRRRRYDTSRIELKLDRKPSCVHLTDLDILQGPEIFTRKGPAGQLVAYKLIYCLTMHFCSF